MGHQESVHLKDVDKCTIFFISIQHEQNVRKSNLKSDRVQMYYSIKT